MMAQDLLTAQEALDTIVSFSIAEEGSNNMYIQLIQVMLTKINPQKYNIVEIEMILNYFPHAIWSTNDEMKELRDTFYVPLLENVNTNL